MIYCSRRALLPVLLGLVVVGSGEAEIFFWKLGGSGLAWSDNDSVQVMIDFENSPGAIQPIYITPERTVFSYLSNWSPLKIPRDLGFVEGERPRSWRDGGGSEATTRNGTYLVDGDSTTYNPPSSTGITYWYTIDLAVPVPAYRFGFFTPSQGFRADGKLLREDVVPAYEVSIAAEGDPSWLENWSYQRIGTLVADVAENFEADVHIDFPKQYVRYVRFRRNESITDQSIARDASRSAGYSGSAASGTIGDFDFYGEGVPQRAIYVTRIIDLGRKMNSGRLFWKTTPMRVVDGVAAEATDAAVSIQVEARTGRDDDPIVYHEYTNKGKELVVSRQRYEYELKTWGGYVTGKRPGVRASQTYDTESWTYWSVPITESGLPLRLDGGSYLQLKITLGSEAFDAFMRLDSLWIEQAPLLAGQIVGEVARIDDPRPVRGFTEAALGEMTDFSYDIRSFFASSTEPGFDAIRLRTGSQIAFRSLEMGDPLVAVTPRQIITDDEEMVVHLPEKITRNENVPIRVILGTRVFILASTFEGEVFDWAEAGLPQPIVDGDAIAEVSTNSLRVLAQAGRLPQPIQRLDFSTAVLTPNGDGVNDELAIQYVLYRLPDPVPVALSIYRLDGTRVARFAVGEQGAGTQQILWNGRDDRGTILAPGLYLVEIALQREGTDSRQVRSVGIAY